MKLSEISEAVQTEQYKAKNLRSIEGVIKRVIYAFENGYDYIHTGPSHHTDVEIGQPMHFYIGFNPKGTGEKPSNSDLEAVVNSVKQRLDKRGFPATVEKVRDDYLKLTVEWEIDKLNDVARQLRDDE